jgi:hypothetical protein
MSFTHTNFPFHRSMSVGTVLPIMAAGYSGLGPSYGYGTGTYPSLAGYSNVGTGYNSAYPYTSGHNGAYPYASGFYPSTSGSYDSGNISANSTLLILLTLLTLRTRLLLLTQLLSLTLQTLAC